MKRNLMTLLFTAILTWNGPVLAEVPLTLMLDWFPNVDHLPIYVAQQRGYFAEEGVAVKILSPSDTTDALKLAAAGKVDLAVSYEPQTVMAASQGIDVRVVGRLIEHPLTTVLFLKSSGFAEPTGLTGRTIGYTVPGMMDLLFDAFARVNGIKDYKLINVGFSIVPALSSGRVAAVMGPFKTYETVTMAAEGIASAFFELEKWGIPDYDELIFICSAKTLSVKKKSVRGFVRAVERGIAFVAKSPESALEDYLRAVPDADRSIETAAFELTRPYYATGQVCDPKRWQVFADFALKHSLIETPVDVAALLPDLSMD